MGAKPPRDASINNESVQSNHTFFYKFFCAFPEKKQSVIVFFFLIYFCFTNNKEMRFFVISFKMI